MLQESSCMSSKTESAHSCWGEKSVHSDIRNDKLQAFCVSSHEYTEVTTLHIHDRTLGQACRQAEKIVRDSSIITKVTAPVAEEKSPMNEEYSLGLGN